MKMSDITDDHLEQRADELAELAYPSNRTHLNSKEENRSLPLRRNGYRRAVLQKLEMLTSALPFMRHKWDCTYGTHIPGRGDANESCSCGLYEQMKEINALLGITD